MLENINKDSENSHPITTSEVKYLLDSVKDRTTLDNRSSSYKIFKQTLGYIEKFSRIKEQSVADDLRSSLFALGCNEIEIALIGSLFPQSIEEAKVLIPSLAIKDNNIVNKIVDLSLKFI